MLPSNFVESKTIRFIENCLYDTSLHFSTVDIQFKNFIIISFAYSLYSARDEGMARHNRVILFRSHVLLMKQNLRLFIFTIVIWSIKVFEYWFIKVFRLLLPFPGLDMREIKRLASPDAGEKTKWTAARPIVPIALPGIKVVKLFPPPSVNLWRYKIRPRKFKPASPCEMLHLRRHSKGLFV